MSEFFTWNGMSGTEKVNVGGYIEHSFQNYSDSKTKSGNQ